MKTGDRVRDKLTGVECVVSSVWIDDNGAENAIVIDENAVPGEKVYWASNSQPTIDRLEIIKSADFVSDVVEHPDRTNIKHDPPRKANKMPLSLVLLASVTTLIFVVTIFLKK